ncbi:MAG: thioredoxin domain-containing protein [Leptolyngbya sp. SIO3F4]|nr:thioredoxin domain-containing protein [Leptolyngbya sp. SIO3F4]
MCVPLIRNLGVRYLIIFMLGMLLLTSAGDAQASQLSQALEEQVIQIIRDHPEVILESVEQYRIRQQQEAQKVQYELLQAINKDPQDFIKQSPIQGQIDSKVLLIEFSDFQCPYCASVHETLQNFVMKHPDEIALVYKHYPLAKIHPEARSAAMAAWAAQQQNKFWEYQDFLFAHQDKLGESLYLQAAESLELDLQQFDQDRQSQAAMTTIQQDMALAEKLGISGTPFFMMNTTTFSGTVEEAFLENKLNEFVKIPNSTDKQG